MILRLIIISACLALAQNLDAQIGGEVHAQREVRIPTPDVREDPVPQTEDTDDTSMMKTRNTIQTYKPNHFGFFCRVESRIEKKSGIAPRFRLGSSEYVDMLEGKLMDEQSYFSTRD